MGMGVWGLEGVSEWVCECGGWRVSGYVISVWMLVQGWM